MILDAQQIFSDVQDITNNAGASATSTNSIDLGALVDHTGASLQSKINVSGRTHWNCVVEDVALLAAVDGAVITFELYHHTAVDAVASGAVYASTTITANTPTDHPDGTQLFSIPLPVGDINRYLECKYSIATQNLSAGSITCWLGGPIQQG